MDLGVNIRLRSEYCVAVLAVQLFLGKAQKARYGKRQYEIQHADNKICLERLEILALYDTGEVVKLGHADNVQHRSILYIDDKLVADGGQYIAHYLRDYDLEHCLRMGHADGHCALKLAAVYGYNAAAHDLCHICARVYGHNEYTGGHKRQSI